MPNVWVSVWCPYTPGARLHPVEVPGERHRGVRRPVVARPEVAGVWLPSQYHAPITGLEVWISIDRSTAALSCIGALNVKMIGMPTP